MALLFAEGLVCQIGACVACHVGGQSRSGEVWSVQGEDCWNVDNVHYLVCTHTHKCRETCQDHGNVDGRCKWGFSNLWPICECLPPNFQ
uniref:Knottin scorpion toxin-like domain-containing protein n=1 Tax=Oryza meridionalis TaxID=40149 RepID=A0A0E0C9S5_9ORYZ